MDVGQFVTAGAPLATVYGTDLAEVRVPLESRELAWFDLPSRAGNRGSRATVSADFAGDRHTWPGTVSRMEAAVDSASRMVHVVVEVARPYAATGDRPPLLPGSFVDVEIAGRTLDGVYRIPRHAVHDGTEVWVVEGDRLHIRTVEVARSDRTHALVSAGLEAGSTVVVSSLDAVTDGMAVRPAEDAGTAPDGGAS